jgi:hypothetical protein
MSTNQPPPVSPVKSIDPINATLVPGDQEAIMAAIGAIKQRLPFLIDLNKDERKGMSKLGNKTHGFVKKVLNIARKTQACYRPHSI